MSMSKVLSGYHRQQWEEVYLPRACDNVVKIEKIMISSGLLITFNPDLREFLPPPLRMFAPDPLDVCKLIITKGELMNQKSLTNTLLANDDLVPHLTRDIIKDFTDYEESP